MAIKKSEFYLSLRQSCDELRGGMDSSQRFVLTIFKSQGGLIYHSQVRG
jgi:hypothetical protein